VSSATNIAFTFEAATIPIHGCDADERSDLFAIEIVEFRQLAHERIGKHITDTFSAQ